MPIQWRGTLSGPDQLAHVIQGEAGTPAGQFAVASVMYNRVQNGGFGNGITAVVTPTQFNGYSRGAPSANAQALANDLWNGNAPQGGDPGNALYFSAANSPDYSAGTGRMITPGGTNIGGNVFSDQFGPPSVNFQPPVYGGGTGSNIAGGGSNLTGGVAGGSDIFSPDAPFTGGLDGIAPDGSVDGGGMTVSGAGTPGFSDITGFQVGGVNAPLDTSSGLSAGSGAVGGAASGIPGVTGAIDPTIAAGGPGAGGATPPGQGMPVNVGLEPSTTQDIGTWVGEVTKAAGQGVQSAISAAESGVGTYFSGIQNWFIRAGLILLAIVLIAVGLMVLLWDHGGKETAGRVMEVAAA